MKFNDVQWQFILKDPSFGLKIWKYIHRQYLMDSYQKKKGYLPIRLYQDKWDYSHFLYISFACLYLFSVKKNVKECTIL